jgi:hypothetical protein
MCKLQRGPKDSIQFARLQRVSGRTENSASPERAAKRTPLSPARCIVATKQRRRKSLRMAEGTQKRREKKLCGSLRCGPAYTNVWHDQVLAETISGQVDYFR